MPFAVAFLLWLASISLIPAEDDTLTSAMIETSQSALPCLTSEPIYEHTPDGLWIGASCFDGEVAAGFYLNAINGHWTFESHAD